MESLSDSFALLSGIAQATQNPWGLHYSRLLFAVSFPVASFGARLLASAVASPPLQRSPAAQVSHSLLCSLLLGEIPLLSSHEVSEENENHTCLYPAIFILEVPLFKKKGSLGVDF